MHQRHRHDRQDRQRSDSIRQTVLQTVAQKAHIAHTPEYFKALRIRRVARNDARQFSVFLPLNDLHIRHIWATERFQWRETGMYCRCQSERHRCTCTVGHKKEPT